MWRVSDSPRNIHMGFFCFYLFAIFMTSRRVASLCIRMSPPATQFVVRTRRRKSVLRLASSYEEPNLKEKERTHCPQQINAKFMGTFFSFKNKNKSLVKPYSVFYFLNYFGRRPAEFNSWAPCPVNLKTGTHRIQLALRHQIDRIRQQTNQPTNRAGSH